MDAETLGLTPESFDSSGALRALHRLQTDLKPTYRRATPLWYLQSPPPRSVWRNIHEPEWGWTSRQRKDWPADARTMLDANGAFLAPVSGAVVAHTELKHTGSLPAMTSKQVHPGYYLINSAKWTDVRIVSPLGQGPMEPQLWVAAPTLVLLLELHQTGHWPAVEIHDSWTCAVGARMSKWAAWLREVRLFAMDTDAQDIAQGADPTEVEEHGATKAVKDGMSMAFQMMIQDVEKGKKRSSNVFRPDWYHSVRATHRANMWRKGWKAAQAGIPILSMGHVDEIEIPSDIVIQLIDMPEPPLRIDVTGRQLGAFKVKR